MRFCDQCGNQIPDDARFCATCGAAMVATYTGPLATDIPMTGIPPAGKRFPLKGVLIVGAICLFILIGFIVGECVLFGRPDYAATLAPEDAAVFCVINPDLAQLSSFNHVKGIYMNVPEVTKALENYQNNIVQSSDIDFDTDIKPWLGREAAIVVPDASLSSNGEPHILLAVASKNINRTDTCLEKIRSSMENQNYRFDETSYDGEKVVTASQDGNTALVYAYANNYLLVSNSEDLVDQAIAKAKNHGQGSLAQSSSYKTMMAKLPRSRAGAIFIQLQSLSGNQYYDQLNQIEQYKSVAMALLFNKQGVRLDSLAELVPGASAAGGSASVALGSPALAPANTLVFLGGTNWASALKSLLGELRSNPGMSEYSNGLNEIESESGIDLSNDLLAWMQGEIALVAMPDNTTFFGQQGAGLGVCALIKVSDEQVAKNKMEMIFSRSGIVPEVGGMVNNEDVYCVRDPDTQNVILSYGFRDQYLVFGSSLTAVTNVMNASDVLANNANFKQATAGLPSPTESCCYLDVRNGLELVRNSLPVDEQDDFNNQVYPFLKPITTISLTSQGNDGMKANASDSYVRSALQVRIQ
jgi:hypothetical protein